MSRSTSGDAKKSNFPLKRNRAVLIPFLILIAAIAAAFGLSATPAWAQAAVPEVSEISVNHTMYANAAAELDGIVYTVNFTPHAPDGETGCHAVPQGVEPSPISITPKTATASVASTEWTRTFSATKTFDEIFGAASVFVHAGIYKFDVSEAASGGSADDASVWAAPSEHYLLRVYVANGTSGLVYEGATISSLDASGNEATNDAGKEEALAFTTKYIATQTLDISKSAVGDFANKTFAFPIEVTFYLPDWTDGTVSQNIVNGNAEGLVPIAFASDAFQQAGSGEPAGSKKAVGTVSLSNGKHASVTVPVGTRYKVNETNPSDGVMPYDVSIDYNVGIDEAEPEVTIKDGFKGNIVAQMSMAQLQAAAAEIAADSSWGQHADANNNYANPDTSTTTGLYASYMMADYSFSFAGDANSEPMEYRIIGLNHSPADGESGLTFMAKRSLDKGYFMREDIDVQNSWGVSEYSWRDTAMRKELNPEVENGQVSGSGQVYSLIPQLVRDSAPVIKKHNNTVIENWNLSADTYDRFWLISPMEFWGEDTYNDYEGDNNGQYEFFAAHGIAPHTDSPIFENMAYTMSGEYFADGVPPEIEHYADDGGTPWGWMRTVYTTEFQTFVRFMDSYSTTFSNAYATWGVHPCFNLGGTNQIPSSAPALPSSKAAVSTTSLSDLHAIGDYITLGWASPAYIAEAENLVGATIEVELANGSTMEARLVDISASHGLTFEATGVLAQSVMETAEKSTVKWNESHLRSSMNETAGEFYTTYFMGTDLDAVVRPVTTISLVYNTWKIPSENDKYWIPSMDNIYGPGWFDYDGGSGNADDEWQFDYYRTMVPALDSNESDVRLVKELNGSPVDWGLRSACPPGGEYSYVAFYENSPTSYYLAVEEIGVVPCFCL